MICSKGHDVPAGLLSCVVCLEVANKKESIRRIADGRSKADFYRLRVGDTFHVFIPVGDKIEDKPTRRQALCGAETRIRSVDKRRGFLAVDQVPMPVDRWEMKPDVCAKCLAVLNAERVSPSKDQVTHGG